ncbi:hypothetical protein AIOL_002117 [Candidatus Rhodobacter oscarellae]|uniref:Tetratricopeptide repeat protein n=1 Tax=Candidatus Rhodobacter oscarellae TaxID=1675527 RepID=A0A0J9E2T6_9RHOB|nr:hypothetical protein [Candidatus Rhodobacter lobularis]KMW57156.1 hypothetical protein AIOL_002117 [Candidatus Rhodobacter lobularis]
MRSMILATVLALPTVAFAAGGGDDSAPTPTSAEKACMKLGKVLADDGKTCVAPSSGALDDAALYQAARAFAYAGQYPETLAVLAAMNDAQDDRVLTYKGFVHRKQGDLEMGNAYYRQAIAKNPDNFLARSYMGQGFVEAGDLVAAAAQLKEIRARGGAGSWAEVSLTKAIESGTTYSY